MADNYKYVKLGTDPNFSFMSKKMILWKYLPNSILMHLAACYGLYLVPTAYFWSILWVFFLTYTCNVAVMMGAHRLYSHKAFKATWPVRLVLMLFQTISGQFSIYTWARDHRVHHKYSDTDADPYNAQRGFFFAQYGWILCRRHPLFREKAALIDDSDLLADKIVMFQKKYYLSIYFVLIYLTMLIPVYVWSESWYNSFFICYALRFMVNSHTTSLINSVAHLYGNKPYDKNIQPTEKMLVTWATGGEGWHNFHHTFPLDYKAAELGSNFNVSARIIELLAWFNLVSDLKTVTPEMVKARIFRTGDGTHQEHQKEYRTTKNLVSKGESIFVKANL